MSGKSFLQQILWFVLALLALVACVPNETPKDTTVLPLAADKPTFLWFFTDP